MSSLRHGTHSLGVENAWPASGSAHTWRLDTVITVSSDLIPVPSYSVHIRTEA